MAHPLAPSPPSPPPPSPPSPSPSSAGMRSRSPSPPFPSAINSRRVDSGNSGSSAAVFRPWTPLSRTALPSDLPLEPGEPFTIDRPLLPGFVRSFSPVWSSARLWGTTHPTATTTRAAATAGEGGEEEGEEGEKKKERRPTKQEKRRRQRREWEEREKREKEGKGEREGGEDVEIGMGI